MNARALCGGAEFRAKLAYRDPKEGYYVDEDGPYKLQYFIAGTPDDEPTKVHYPYPGVSEHYLCFYPHPLRPTLHCHGKAVVPHPSGGYHLCERHAKELGVPVIRWPD